MSKTNDSKSAESWASFYKPRLEALGGRYPTEWVVRTLAGGRYPELKLNRDRYRGAKILDIGCGDGRNMPLLLDLGFEVTAVEISDDVVASLSNEAAARGWPVRYQVGSNASLPFDDASFDFVLCSSSCYYLDEGVSWDAIRAEISRVTRVGGLLFANFPKLANAVLADAQQQPDGSYRITNDPFSVRNGTRFMVPRSRAHLIELLSPQFKILGIGEIDDDFYGLAVSAYISVSERV